MLTRALKLLSVVVALALVCLAPVMLFAQDANPMPDPKAAAAQAVTLLTPVIGLFVLWAFKGLWAKIPANLVLIAGPVLGIVINYGAAYLIGHAPADPLVAAAFGAAATWLREIGSTTASKGLLGSITPTKLLF